MAGPHFPELSEDDEVLSPPPPPKARGRKAKDIDRAQTPPLVESTKGKGKNSQGKAAAGSKANKNSKTKAKEAKRGGRQQGSTNFSDRESVELVKVVETVLPIGGHGWDEVLKQYNVWAGENKFSERDVRSVRQRFDRVRSCLHS